MPISTAPTVLTVSSASPFVTPSPSYNNFLSDTVTTPSFVQLQALTSPTLSLGDDVYRESTTTTDFVNRLCKLTGKAHGLFVTSGTQSNQVALLTHLARSGGPPHSIVTDAASHIVNYEAGGIATLGGCHLIPISAKNGKWITLEEVKKHSYVGRLGQDEHYTTTKAVSLENTINGVVMPISEMRRIQAWAKENGVMVHLDGARLWNAAIALTEQKEGSELGALKSVDETLKELVACVDTVSICLSKGIGAPVGSVLLADDDKFIAHARRFRKMLGGGLRQTGVLTAMADAAVTEVWESDNAARMQRTHHIARRLAKKWVDLGEKLEKDTESSMVWLAGVEDVEGGVERWEKIAKEEGCRVAHTRMVVHWQISDESVEGVERAMERFCEEKRRGEWGGPAPDAKEAKRVGYR